MSFLLFLTIVFAVEVAIMFALPVVVPLGRHPIVASLIDATCLSVVIAPIAWWLFMVPLQRRLRERGQLLDRILTAQEEERAAVVRDLHDGIGQLLTTLLVRMRVLEQQYGQPGLHEQIVALRAITNDAALELRRMVRATRPPILDDLGICSALERRSEELAGDQQIAVELDCQFDEEHRLPGPIETAAYRVVMEALNNAIKHASPTTISVRLWLEHARVEGEVRDDGKGFHVRQVRAEQAFGIAGIRERCEALQGRLTVESQPGLGTTVRFTIPCGEASCQSVIAQSSA